MMQTLGVSFEYVGQNFMAICVKEMYVLVLRIPSKMITALAISIFATSFAKHFSKKKKKCTISNFTLSSDVSLARIVMVYF